jgi:hypothetical protein
MTDKTKIQKSGIPFDRFQQALKHILSVPKKSLSKKSAKKA